MGSAKVFAKHQAGAIIATVVDFSTMIACVKLLGLSPVLGTAIGATCGAVTNFLVGRHWVFRATTSAAHGQAARYALVSGASLGWNTLGEYVVNVLLGIQYVLARLIVSVLVSFFWNFPMHRAFVFRARAKAL